VGCGLLRLVDYGVYGEGVRGAVDFNDPWHPRLRPDAVRKLAAALLDAAAVAKGAAEETPLSSAFAAARARWHRSGGRQCMTESGEPRTWAMSAPHRGSRLPTGSLDLICPDGDYRRPTGAATGLRPGT
jgi:hypothetical protein